MSKVSIIIPTYNCAAYLREAIDSALGQTYPDVEVIVVDDGSTDNTGDVAASFADRVTHIRQDNSGPSVARNRGILAARGDYLGFLDADDRLLPNMVATLLPHFASDDRVGLVYCGYHLTDSAGRIFGASDLGSPSGHVFPAFYEQKCDAHASLIRREAFATAGLWEPSVKFAEDFDLWIRLARDWRFVFVAEHLAYYRQWEDSTGRQPQNRLSSQRVFLSRMRDYVVDGSVSAKQWASVRQRMAGYPTEKASQDAFLAHWAGDELQAARLARFALLHRPRHCLNRGLWVLALKPTLRRLSACRGGTRR